MLLLSESASLDEILSFKETNHSLVQVGHTTDTFHSRVQNRDTDLSILG